jgi:hypothetical protein
MAPNGKREFKREFEEEVSVNSQVGKFLLFSDGNFVTKIVAGLCALHHNDPDTKAEMGNP